MYIQQNCTRVVRASDLIAGQRNLFASGFVPDDISLIRPPHSNYLFSLALAIGVNWLPEENFCHKKQLPIIVIISNI